MKNKCGILILLLLVLGCSARTPLNTVTQTSTIDILLAGGYDGEMTCAELLEQGDFGIGTFDRLDGEMIVLDGRIYQVRADGRVYRPAGATRTPFASVSRFDADKVVEISSRHDYPELQKLLDTHITDSHLFQAIRITGRFSAMHTRSVPAQEKPYPSLAKVAETQSEFRMTDVFGTIVGFRCPEYVKGINVPGYHLHFLSNDGKQGGHILEFILDSGKVEIDNCNRFVLIMPENGDGLDRFDFTRDRSEELERVEKEKKSE